MRPVWVTFLTTNRKAGAHLLFVGLMAMSGLVFVVSLIAWFATELGTTTHKIAEIAAVGAIFSALILAFGWSVVSPPKPEGVQQTQENWREEARGISWGFLLLFLVALGYHFRHQLLGALTLLVEYAGGNARLLAMMVVLWIIISFDQRLREITDYLKAIEKHLRKP